MPDQKPEMPEEVSNEEDVQAEITYLSTLEAVARATAIVEMLARLQASHFGISRLGAFPENPQPHGSYADFIEDVDASREAKADDGTGSGKGSQSNETLRFIDWFIKQQLENYEIEKLLSTLLPEEEIFKKNLCEQVKEDPACLVRILLRLMRLRRERGVLILSGADAGTKTFEVEALPEVKDPRKGKISAVENITRLQAIFHVLSDLENFYHGGALPEQTFALVALGLIDEYELDKFLSQFLPTSEWVKNGKTPGFSEPLKTRMGKEPWCFRTTFNRLVVAAVELFPVLGLGFVDEFFEKFTVPNSKFQVQSILRTLQKRLSARQEAVEGFEYHRLETIDKNIKELLETLKNYGIKASTYDEALQQHRKLYEAPEKPLYDEAAIEREIEAELKKRISIEDVGVRMTEKYPKHADFIKRYIDRRHNPRGF